MKHRFEDKRLAPAAGAMALSAAMAVLTSVPGSVRAESELTLYGGQGWTADSDVELMRPGGTHLTFADVSWETKPFKLPPYWGIRYTHSPADLPKWDFAVDLLHAKMYSDLAQTVAVSGRRDGAPVESLERLGDTFSVFEFTDGHNLLTTNALRRWQPFQASGKPDFQPSIYVGGGLGLALPHSEVAIPGSTTSEYQFAGPAVQFLAGGGWPIADRIALRAEYRLSWTDLDSELSGGGHLLTKSATRHLSIGIGYRFGGKR
ncbi:MAG: outer membrane protein, partial [Gammaproteobacteria bacterium]